jgi:hypothetical protein
MASFNALTPLEPGAASSAIKNNNNNVTEDDKFLDETDHSKFIPERTAGIQILMSVCFCLLIIEIHLIYHFSFAYTNFNNSLYKQLESFTHTCTLSFL